MAGTELRERQRFQFEHFSHWIILGVCAFVALVTGLVLLGWALGNEALIYFPTPHKYMVMVPLSALGMLFGALGLWALRKEQPTGRERAIGISFGGAQAFLGLLLILEYARDMNLGIDTLLFSDATRHLVQSDFPGRSSVASAFGMLAVGVALCCLDAKLSIRRFADTLLALGVLVALERFISYVFGESGAYAPRWRLFGEPIFNPMAPKTAACVLALSVGMLCARPKRALASIFLASGPAGMLARWMLPVAFLAPLAFGWLGLAVIRAGLKGTEFPLSLVATGMITVLLLLICTSAVALYRTELERRRAEDDLADRERLLRAVFDNAGAGIFVVDVEGKPIKINKTLQHMLGYSDQEMRNLHYSQVLHPEELTTSLKMFRELVAGERNSYRLEKRYIRRDGTLFWAELNTSVSHSTKGVPDYVIGLVEDITDRKEAEEAQGRLTAILDATPDFVGMTDKYGSATYLNRSGRELTGINEDELKTLTIRDFHPPASAQLILNEGVPTAIREGVWTGETELILENGDIVPVSQVILAHKKANGEVLYLSTILRDISDRKRLENAQHFLLDTSRAVHGSLELERILRSLGALVVPNHADHCVTCLMSAEGRIERAAIARNGAAEKGLVEQLRMFPAGRKPNPILEHVAKSGEATIIPNITEDWLGRMIRSTKHPRLTKKLGPRSLLVVPLRGHDRILGVICWSLTQARRRYDANDLALAQEMAGSMAHAIDNSELLKQSRDATRIRDEVLRVVAHDLRNPLNTIALTSDLLRDPRAQMQSADWRKRLEVIQRSVNQADHLIEDLLDVARMEVGKLTVEPHPVDTRALCTEVMQMSEPIAEQSGIKLRAEVPVHVDAIYADRARLLQVFGNLIGNAVKFSQRGSVVTVRVNRRSGVICFSVHDNGPGIQKEDMPHLFNPFWQARKGGQGAGLGLAITKAIVQAHGGKIWVESVPNVGSTFYFTMPLAQRMADESKAAD